MFLKGIIRMKKILLIFALLASMIAAIPAAAAPAETAYPSPSVITVDGTPVDFCAYNIYGNNYFMLRDVAAALKDTAKKFSIEWTGSIIGIRTPEYKYYREYEPAGTEFLQDADENAEAYFPVPDIYVYDERSNNDIYGTREAPVGYNINGSNYFKIRDIARMLDFEVSYNDGVVAIDTSKPYSPEAPYTGEGVIGKAYEADLALFINEMPIVSYYATVDNVYDETQLERINQAPRLSGAYIEAESLKDYGFDVEVYEDSVWLTRNRDKTFGMLDGEIINSPPDGVSDVYSSDIRVYLDGADTRNIIINGKPFISAAELLKYGGVYKRLQIGFPSAFDNGVCIDFMRYELEEKYASAGDESVIDVDDTNSTDFGVEGRNYKMGTFSFKVPVGIGKLQLSYDYQTTKYIGELTGHTYDGKGIYTYGNYGSRIYSTYYKLRRGIFRDGVLYDGIDYSSGSTYNEDGKRIEGAMVNGYRREATSLWLGSLAHDNRDDFRFGYRVDCEGTVENGEYVGYYRQFDESGDLIYEGDYADKLTP